MQSYLRNPQLQQAMMQRMQAMPRFQQSGSPTMTGFNNSAHTSGLSPSGPANNNAPLPQPDLPPVTPNLPTSAPFPSPTPYDPTGGSPVSVPMPVGGPYDPPGPWDSPTLGSPLPPSPDYTPIGSTPWRDNAAGNPGYPPDTGPTMINPATGMPYASETPGIHGGFNRDYLPGGRYYTDNTAVFAGMTPGPAFANYNFGVEDPNRPGAMLGGGGGAANFQSFNHPKVLR